MNNLKAASWSFVDSFDRLTAVLTAGSDFFMERLKNAGVNSYVILETCNRLEIYYEHDNALTIHDAPEPSQLFEGTEAIRHLFRVASGIESLSAGENEILGQVKDAYEKYLSLGTVSKELALLFRKAISVGKLSREKTGISRGKVSIPHFMVDTLQGTFGISGRKVLVVGTGKMANDISRYIMGYSPDSLIITGRNVVSAMELSGSVGAGYAPYDQVDEIAATSDIIVTATISKDLLFTKDRVKSIGGSKCYVDVSTPRNIDPSIMGFNGNFLISTENIIDRLNENRTRRESEIQKVSAIVDDEIIGFLSKLTENNAENLLSEMYNYSKIIEKEEIEKFKASLASGKDPVEAAALMLRSSMGRSLSPLTFAVKTLIRQGGMKSVNEVLDTIVQEFIRDSAKHSYPPEGQPARRNLRSQIPQITQKP